MSSIEKAVGLIGGQTKLARLLVLNKPLFGTG